MRKGWETKKLGDVYDVKDGTHDSPKYVAKGHALITSKNLKNDSICFQNIRYISEQDYININKRSEVDIGDILFAMIGTIGNPVVVKDKPDFAIKNVALFKVPKNQDSYFLKYYLDSDDVIYKMSKDAKGATQKFVGLGYLRNFEILLPPLPEQQRIVAILNEVFVAIAKSKANAEQNLKNAKELFESYLRGVFEHKGEDWKEKRFDEICVLQRGFDLPTHSRNEGGFPLVSSNGVTDKIDLWKVKAPGVVTGRSGTIGNVHFIEEDYWPLNTALYIKEFHGNYERFIYYFLKQFNLRKYSSGAGVPTLNRNNVHSEIVWFPISIKGQKRIVQKLDALSTETKRLEAIYQQKIRNLEELKRSILQKAFSGELTSELVLS